MTSRFTLSLVVVMSLGLCRPAHAQLPHNIPTFCSAGELGHVIVGAGQTYELRQQVDECVRIEAGATAVWMDGADYRVTTFQVMPGGEFRTERDGISGRVTIRNRPLNTSIDPEQYGNGLILLGQVHLAGVAVPATFARLGDEIRAGQPAFTLAEPFTAAVGDRLVFPGSNQHFKDSEPYQPQWETCVAATVGSAAIACTQPFQFPHLGAYDQDGVRRFLPHVGNLSRSLVIRSEDPSGTRGHVIFTATAEVDVRYVRFEHLGRTTIAPLDNTTYDGGQRVLKIGTNQIGRYPAHFHHVHAGTRQPNGRTFNFIGNAIEGSPKGCVIVHGTHEGLVQDNVCYDTAGAAFVTEDGSETGNHFDHNLSVKAWGTGDDRGDQRKSQNDWWWEGVNFWFRGPANLLTRNVGANANAYGLAFMMVGAAWESADKSIQRADRQPFQQVQDNEFYSVFGGFTVWDYLATCCADVHEGPEVPIRDLRFWHVGKRAYYGYGSNRLTIDGFTQINDPRYLWNPSENPVGFYFADYLAPNTTLRHLEIQGVRVAIEAPYKAGDVRSIYGNAPGVLTVEDARFRTAAGLAVVGPQFGVTGGGGALPPRAVIARNVQWQGFPAALLRDATMAANQRRIIHTFFNRSADERPNFFLRDRLIVEDPGAPAFEVFAPEQAAGVTIYDNPAAAPYGGLTNQQAWTQAGIAIAGAVAPCAATRPDVWGFTCPVSDAPVPPPPPPPAEVCGDGIDNDGDGQVDEGCRIDCRMSEWREPTDADWTPWGPDGSLTQTRTATRTRTILVQPQHGGTACGATSETVMQTRTLPPPPATVSVATKIIQCQYIVTDTPPAGYDGGKVQFRRDSENHGTADSSAPYSRTANLAFKPYTFTAVWTKAGMPTFTRAPYVERTCAP